MESDQDQDSLYFDHAVLVVANLPEATRQFQGLGFTVIPGGIHAGNLTHNALIAFRDGSYLELLAPYSRLQYLYLRLLNRLGLIERHRTARTPLGRRFAESLLIGQGINDFALRSGNLQESIARARRQGLLLDGPTPGGRVRPDGQNVSWRTACPETRDLPFAIEDVTPRALRVPAGEAVKHPNRGSGVVAVTITVTDLTASTDRYSALLDMQPGVNAGESFIEMGQQAHRFQVRGTTLVVQAVNRSANQSQFLGQAAGRPQRIWLRCQGRLDDLKVLECTPGQTYYLSSPSV